MHSTDHDNTVLRLCEQVRNDKLIADSEARCIQQLNEEINDNVVALCKKSWICFQDQILLNRLITSHPLVTTDVVCQECAHLNAAVTLPAYKAIGHHHSNIDLLLTILLSEPLTVASLLNSVELNQCAPSDEASCTIFSLVYSCGAFPSDEKTLLQTTFELMRLQLMNADDPRVVLRKGNSMACRFYRLFADSLYSAKIYLTSALHDAVMLLLCQDEIFLDIDPSKSNERFPPAMRSKKFGIDPSSLEYSQKMEKHRQSVVHRLVLLTNDFLMGIETSIAHFPRGLIWLVQQVFRMLVDVKKLSVDEAELICTDLIVTNLLCPAITNPEKIGIISDIPVGHIARFNLMQVAQIIQALALSKFEKPSPVVQMITMQFENSSMQSFVSKVLSMKLPTDDFEPSESTYAMDVNIHRTHFLGTASEVDLLVKILREGASTLENLSPSLDIASLQRVPQFHTSQQPSTSEDKKDSTPKSAKLKGIKMNFSFAPGRRSNATTDSENDARKNELLVFNYRKNYLSDLPTRKEVKQQNEVTLAPANDDNLISFCNEVVQEEAYDEVGKAAGSDPFFERIEGVRAETPGDEPLTIAEFSTPVMEEAKNDKSPAVREDKKPPSFFKIMGDKVKKGITPLTQQLSHSATLNDFMSDFNIGTPTHRSGMTSSASETALSAKATSTTPQMTADEILAKYATKTKEPPTVVLVDTSAKHEDSPEPYYSSSNLDSCRAFTDTLRKLQSVLGNVSHLPRFSSLNESSKAQQTKLLELLRALLAEQIHGRQLGMAAQIREVIRCVNFFDSYGIDTLLHTLEKEHEKHVEHIAEAQTTRINLMRTSSVLQTLQQRVELDQLLHEESLVHLVTRAFFGLQNEGKALSDFVYEFSTLKAQDERADFVQKMLDTLYDKIPKYTMWKGIPESMAQCTRKTMEREVMQYIHNVAFFPNKDADILRDKLFHDSVTVLSARITPKSAALDINPKLHGEAPWPSAQAEIKVLNAYKSPLDKLACVVRCCESINNLVAMAAHGSVTADDLTPIFVYVLIHANPQFLLSNMQYMDTFAGKLIEGREGYYWTLFRAAVEFIKTLL